MTRLEKPRRVGGVFALGLLSLFAACRGGDSSSSAAKSDAAVGLGRSEQIGIVAASPNNTAELVLPPDLTPIDVAAVPTGPEVALLLRDAGGRARVATWTAGDDHTTSLIDLPPGFSARAITHHPAKHALFVSGSVAGKSQILALTNTGSAWTSAVILESPREIDQLVVGPRPFQIADSLRYRVFFAAKLAGGGSSLRSVTETGKVEYQVAGPTSEVVDVKGVEAQPVNQNAPSAVPLGFHPRGQPLVWQDRRGCAHTLSYGNSNWNDDRQLSSIPCDGSLSVTPNGTAYLHWKSGQPGIVVVREDGRGIGQQALGYTFSAAPVSVPDGKGVIGIVAKGGRQSIVYAPISVPLADVANAWQLAGNACEEQLLATNGGLFLERPATDQLYSPYETEKYGDAPLPPFLVTTDLFWENFSAAFNGVFILLEQRRATPAFWSFVAAANTALAGSAPASPWGKVFAALSAMHAGVTTGEAERIAHDSLSTRSIALDTPFKFAELKPRSHYTTSAEMKEYFRAVHYLTEVGRIIDPAPLAALPPDVQRKATDWIEVYRPFIAPSRAKLVWSAAAPALIAPYAFHKWKNAAVFPLSWGLDNEALESSVYHSTWPDSEQIIGPRGPRLFASGVDVATVYGSALGRSLLAPDLAQYPLLGPVLNHITSRRPVVSDSSNLYDRWLDALSVEWADSTSFPGSPRGNSLWSAKRLQTGLASWASLREVTLLVNERAGGAEAGEGGFEELIPDQPRGYVEPAPKTFEAIAALYDAIGKQVSSSGDLGVGDEAKNPWKKDEPLRQGILRRLTETAAETRRFRVMAEKELRGETLADSEYAAIRDVAGTIEHEFLIYKSLANKDLALASPDPLAKIADVAGDLNNGLLEVAVGGPLEWHQIAPFFGRRQIVLGSVYSYYEFTSMKLYDNETWRKEVSTHARPAWIQPLVAASDKSCRAAASR